MITAAATALRAIDAREAARIWPALEASVADAPLACSWAWTRTWLDHYGDAVDAQFVVAEDPEGAPTGIALLTHPHRPVWQPRVVHVGTAGEPRGEGVFVERNGLLAHDPVPFARRLAYYVDTDPRWDRLSLDGMLPEVAEALAEQWPQAALTVERSPFVALQEGDDALGGLRPSAVRRVRQTLRAFGELELEWPQDGDRARAVLGELMLLHRRHWEARDQGGAFASRRQSGFHHALLAELLPQGRAAVVRVHRGAETVACLYGLIEGDRLLFYQGGVRPYTDNRLRAGLAGHAMFLHACRQRGLARYDFLAPAVRYKLELAGESEPLVWGRIERRGLRTGLSRATRPLREGR